MNMMCFLASILSSCILFNFSHSMEHAHAIENVKVYLETIKNETSKDIFLLLYDNKPPLAKVSPNDSYNLNMLLPIIQRNCLRNELTQVHFRYGPEPINERDFYGYDSRGEAYIHVMVKKEQLVNARLTIVDSERIGEDHGIKEFPSGDSGSFYLSIILAGNHFENSCVFVSEHCQKLV